MMLGDSVAIMCLTNARVGAGPDIAAMSAERHLWTWTPICVSTLENISVLSAVRNSDICFFWNGICVSMLDKHHISVMSAVRNMHICSVSKGICVSILEKDHIISVTSVSWSLCHQTVCRRTCWVHIPVSICSVFSMRQHICRAQSVLLPVLLSVCPSVTWVDQSKTV